MSEKKQMSRTSTSKKSAKSATKVPSQKGQPEHNYVDVSVGGGEPDELDKSQTIPNATLTELSKSKQMINQDSQGVLGSEAREDLPDANMPPSDYDPKLDDENKAAEEHVIETPARSTSQKVDDYSMTA